MLRATALRKSVYALVAGEGVSSEGRSTPHSCSALSPHYASLCNAAHHQPLLALEFAAMPAGSLGVH